MFLDLSYSDINIYDFKSDENWTDFYGYAIEAKPHNAPKPLGKNIDLRMFVVSDHAGDKMNCCSSNGYMIFMNKSMIDWHIKKHATVESAVIESEFVAIKQGVKALRRIRYKLRMMGIEISGPTYIYGDNISVVHNTSKHEPVLKKKSNSICYHFVREAVSMKECLTTHVPTLKNWADLLTKVISGKKRQYLFSGVLYDIYYYE